MLSDRPLNGPLAVGAAAPDFTLRSTPITS